MSLLETKWLECTQYLYLQEFPEIIEGIRALALAVLEETQRAGDFDYGETFSLRERARVPEQHRRALRARIEALGT